VLLDCYLNYRRTNRKLHSAVSGDSVGSWSNCDFGEEPVVADLETHNEIDCLCKIYLASFGVAWGARL